MEMTLKCPCCGQKITLEVVKPEDKPKHKYNIIALMGPSACGKSTLLDKIINEDKEKKFYKIKAMTTRPKRDNEDDNAYFFVDEDTFNAYPLLEKTQFRDWYYGTSIYDLVPEQWNIGIFSPEAIKQLVDNPFVNKLEVFYLYTDEKERIKRSLDREDNPDIEEILRRALADREDFASENLTFCYRTLPSNCPEDMDYSLECIREVANGQK